MKTKILSILALLLMTVTQGAWAQETLTVYDGTAVNRYIPMNSYIFDYYTKCECIIPASELTAMEGGTITAITFYARAVATQNAAWTNTNQKVFLKEVSGTTLSSYSGMTDATVVFDGTLPMPTTSASGYTISFSPGYTYNGGNLLIGVYNDAKGKYNQVTWYGIDNQSSGVSAYGYSTLSPAEVGFTKQNFLPKTTFTYTPANVGRVIGLDGKYYKTKEAAVNAGTQACAIIAYVGSETGEAGYTGGLAIAMRDANGGTAVQWKNANGTADNPNQYSNIANAISAKESGSSLSSGRTNSTTWPAFYHALNNTITTSSGISASKPTSGTSGWFLPSIYQWNIILKALSGESNNLSDTDNNNFKPAAVNVKIADADARLGSYNYLSSSEIDNSRPWYWYADGGRAAGGLNKTHTATVRAVFAFNTLTAAEYTVTYDANGGSGAPDAQTKDGGIDLTLSSTVPTRTGYTFAGWNTKADGSGTSYAAGGSYTTNDDIVLYAQWFAGEGTEASPYLIASTTDWNNLVSAVNGGETYSGNYFKMTANVGTVTTWMTGTFSGTFDGDGKTLTVDYSATTEKCAPFGTLSGATIQNLKVAGSISSNQRLVAGIAAWCSSTGNNVTNCLVSATINSSYSGNAADGGLVSLVDDGASLNVTGCAFAGKMLTTNGTTSCGGIVGWRRSSGTVTITNCLYAPTPATGSETWIASAEGENGNANFCRWNSSEPTITNCYYTTDFGSGDYTAQGLQARSISAGDYVTVANAGAATVYNVSGITSYGTGIQYGGVLYGGNEDAVSLTLTAPEHDGYGFVYSADNGTVTGNGNPYTLTMVDANAIINVKYSASKAINKYTSDDTSDGWYLIASPIGIVSPEDVTNMTANTYDIYRFNQNPTPTMVDEVSQYLEWENWKKEENVGETNHYHFDLEPGRGYLYANSADVTLTFTGMPYVGDGVVSLEYKTDNPVSSMHGWNLIGNPFGVTAYIDRDFYRMNYGEGNTGGNEIIPATNTSSPIAPMEGIFVYAEEEGLSVTFSTQAPSKGHIQKPESEQVVLNLSHDRGSVIDRAIVRMGEGQNLPKFQIRENSTKLYIPQGAKDYAIATSDGQGEMPLNFKANANGEYTLTVNPENVEMNYLHLIDNMTGADIDLLATTEYTFTAKTTDYESRFKLVFVCGDANDDNDDETFAFFSNGNWIIANEGQATLQVIDLNGRILSSETINDAVAKAIKQPAGVYMIRLINGDNVKVQKIVVR